MARATTSEQVRARALHGERSAFAIACMRPATSIARPTALDTTSPPAQVLLRVQRVLSVSPALSLLL